ncbi:MAG: PaaI family thioesterase [bacterium]
MSDPALFEMVRSTLQTIVPFARTIGVDITEVGDGSAAAQLEFAPERANHIGTMHAGAVYTLGEAASGAACAGVFAEQLMTLRPVAAEATIKYIKVSKGSMTATAHTDRPAEELRADLSRNGKTRFNVQVSLRDETGADTAEMMVAWAVKAPA